MAWRFLFLLCIQFSLFSQDDPRALRASLLYHQRASDTDSACYFMRRLGFHYLEQKRYDSAGYYLRHATQIAEKGPGLAEALNNLGVMHFHLANFDSCIYYYEASHAQYVALRDTSNIIVLEINLSATYKLRGLYEKALGFSLSASRKLEKREPSAHLAQCYNAIANLYSRIGQPHSALTYHGRSLDVRKQIGDEKNMASSYNNMGNVYLDLEQYDSAISNYRKSLALKRRYNDKAAQGSSLSNIGEVLVKTGNLGEAKEYFLQALEIRMEFRDKVGEAATRNRLANVHLLNGDFAAAQRELDRSHDLAVDLGLLEELKTNHEIRIKLYEEKGDYKRAFETSQQLLIVKDSLLNQEKTKSIAEMQTRYESLKKEDRIALLEKEGLLQAVELERRQMWILSLIVAVILTAIIGVLIYHNFRTVRKNKVHIELLLKELHHRVKNNLQILSSLLSLQSQQLTDDTAIKAVKSSESRINAMALIHRKLYTVDKNRTVDIKEYITELIQYLVYSYGYHEKNFKLDLEIKEISIDVDKAIPLGLILNELISNAFKHAYENNPNPRLVVNLEYPESHELNIRIQDNGAGMPAVDEKQRKTFGMKIVTTLIKELKGSLNVNNENGTTYNLQIPI